MDANNAATYIDAYARGYRDAARDHRNEMDDNLMPSISLLPILLILTGLYFLYKSID